MGTAIMLVCIITQLVAWDLWLKVAHAFAPRAAERHLDRHVSGMAHRMIVLASCYGGLTVDLDRELATGVPDPALVCANHQSIADIVVLLDAFRAHRLRFVAKRELGRGFPAVSEVLRIQRHALINRSGDFKRGARQLHTLGHRIRTGVSPAVFPEGTRSRTGVVGTFNPGAVRTILSGQSVPIAAVAVDGGYRFVSLGDTIAGLRNIVYRAKLVGVFEHDGTKAGVMEAMKASQLAVQRQIDAWRAQSP